jgi:hypothetical protein
MIRDARSRRAATAAIPRHHLPPGRHPGGRQHRGRGARKAKDIDDYVSTDGLLAHIGAVGIDFGNLSPDTPLSQVEGPASRHRQGADGAAPAGARRRSVISPA